ncbi:hypothetical protein K474DRAFT_1676514 [Panus rudis PR-1116 ss-1]|nr:hypothetical protein K474DRAFT_1676514 [Panus rudis PR-1116 ss-1]
MTLGHGIYFIQVGEDKRNCGRNFVEDMTLRPKTIYRHPQGFHVSPYQSGWLVEKIGDKYKLKANHVDTGVYRGYVSAFLLAEMAPGELGWILEPAGEENWYYIKSLDGKGGWKVENPSGSDLSKIIVADNPDKFHFVAIHEEY